MATFKQLFHPAVLSEVLKADPTGKLLMHRLFDDSDMGTMNGSESLMYWLIFKRAGGYVYCGRPGEFNQHGILCKNDGCYNYNGQKKTPITTGEAIACAKETLEVINHLCAFIDDSIANNVTIDSAWYKAFDEEVTKICRKQAHTPLWYGADRGFKLRPYLIKYLHILYPEIFAGFYSEKHIKIALHLLGIAYSTDLSVIENNGLISQKMKVLIPNNPNGVKFAKALYPLVYEISDKTN